MKLNDTLCKNSKPFPPPSKSPKKLADGDGLYLWVMPNGAKYWRFLYTINGIRKLAAFGVYPEVSLNIQNSSDSCCIVLVMFSRLKNIFLYILTLNFTN
jgi:hypothetical protein